MKEKVIKALRDAAELMNLNGAHWTKGELRDTSPRDEFRYCSLGAIYKVTGLDLNLLAQLEEEGDDSGAREAVREDGDSEVRLAAIRALCDSLFDWPDTTTVDLDTLQINITSWNDAATREWPDVQEAFEKAAQKLEAGAP